jgi:transcriptional regulator with XRE-family HTH domain
VPGLTTDQRTPDGDDEPVGLVLRRMRLSRKVSGRELADSVQLSQSTVSRIERGISSPAPGDIRKIAQALGADERQVQDLVRQAERSRDRMTDWRPTSATLASRQKDMAAWESEAQVTSDFQPAVLPGLLQVSGYAKAVLRLFQRLAGPATGEPTEAAVLAAVSGRFRRQEVLANHTKTFSFVITEGALKNSFCPPAEMLAQIHHLRDIAANYETVSLAAVPDGVPMPIPPMHGFTLFDDKLVVIDIYNTGLISRGRKDVEIYHEIFETIHGSASPIEPLLDKYQALYVDAIQGR